jgi:MFS transporter, DHA1 family, inner membrane transport protein
MTTIEQSYAPPRLYPKLGVLAAGLFLVGTNAFVIAGLLPDIASTFGVQPSEVSYSITYYSLVVAVAAPAISILLPRLSRTTLLVAGLVLFVIGGLVAATAPTLLLFTIGRLVAALGGAAIVPTATAAAAALAPAAQRGRALGFVTIGFTLATAVGSPLGTIIGAAGGWRLPLLLVVALAVVVAIVVGITIRGIPTAPPASVLQRVAILKKPRVVAPLIATLLMLAGFNVVYIFSSGITAPTTGGSGSLLAVLLFAYGIAGVVGNAISGPVTDRIGSRATVAIALGGEAVVLALFPVLIGSFTAMIVLFAIWGVVAFAASVPVQHRLVSVDPQNSALAMSWFTTAMYLGIALAPLLGAAASSIVGVALVPIVGSVVTLIALAIAQAGYLRRRRSIAR